MYSLQKCENISDKYRQQSCKKLNQTVYENVVIENKKSCIPRESGGGDFFKCLWTRWTVEGFMTSSTLSQMLMRQFSGNISKQAFLDSR